jgi:NADPH:quinone reductase-like Zn-dependent oxidoreductase
MKAAVRRTYRTPDQIQIEEIAQPVPKDKEVLIKVHATTVNRTDCANLTAKPFIMRFVLGFFKPRQPILGTDFAGEVVALGKHVKSLVRLERVFGFHDTGLGSQTEYFTLPEKHIFRIPANIDFRRAAASLEGAHYAYTFIHKTNIQPGQRVLINGATGAIGSALLQFVRQYGVHLTTTCDPKNIDLIRSLGADQIIDYMTEDFTQTNMKYDFIFDAVGKSTFGVCKPLLNEGGVYISSELGPWCQNIFFALWTSVFGDRKVIFPIPFPTRETIPYIMKMLKDGTFRPVIDREYKLADVTKAYAYVISGQKTGNVVLGIANS